MTKPQTILKDFSELEPVDKRIEMTAFAVFQVVHRGEKERAFQPKPKTVVHKVWSAGRLSMRQQSAWHRFMKDFDRAEGNSGGVTGAYGDYTDKCNDGFRVPTAHVNSAYLRVTRICNALSRSQYALLADLIQDDLKGTDNIKLEFIGLMRSGYQDKNSARVAGVVHIQNLLDRLAELQGF